MEQKQRIIYLEKIRVFALLMVLYTHSGAGALYFQNASTTLGYWVSLAMLPVSQCCVVLFFMISGAVLLHKQESIKQIYLHRVLPTAMVTILIVLLQYIQNCMDYKRSFSLLEYFECLYSGGALTEHWFLYAYLSFLLILPFLRAVVAGLEGVTGYRYLFVLMVALNTVFPMWEAVSDWDGAGLSVPLLTNIVFYPLMGYYVERGGDRILADKRALLVADAAAVALVFGNALMNHHSFVLGGRAAYQTIFLAYFTCVIFWNFKMLGNRGRYAAFWRFAGAGVFGTYLLEPQLRRLMKPLIQFASVQKTPYLINLFVIVLLGSLGILLTNLLKKLPGIKRLL